MIEPYAHQLEAFHRYKDQDAIPLFFSPGTGKTRTALMIAEYKYMKGDIDCILIVAPNGVHSQWATQEIPKWLSVPYNLVWKQNQHKGLVPTYKDNMLNIYCTNIETFSTATKWNTIVDWALAHKTAIILDEAQTIKNVQGASRAQRLIYGFNDVVRRRKTIIRSTPLTVARIALTGTPLTKSPTEMWSIFEFLRPNYFKKGYYEFQSYYTIMMTIVAGGTRNVRIPITKQVWDNVRKMSPQEAMTLFNISLPDILYIQSHGEYSGPYKNLEELKEKIYEQAMRVSLEDCISMPGKSYVTRKVPMTPTQKRLIYELKTQMVAEYKDGLVSAQSMLAARIRMQQIASGFVSYNSENTPNDVDTLLNKDYNIDEVEWIEDAVLKINRMLLDAKEIEGPFIVVCHFTCEARKLYDAFKEAGFATCLQTGSMKIGTIAEFQEGKYDCMIANVRVIAKGFNLQNACHMLFYSNTYSLEDRIQVEARIYRSGQTQKCMYIDYNVENSEDEHITQRLRENREVYDFIMEDENNDDGTKTGTGGFPIDFFEGESRSGGEAL